MNGVPTYYYRLAGIVEQTQGKRTHARNRQYTLTQLVHRMFEGAQTIDRLVRLDNFEFSTQIDPVVQWALENLFWCKQLHSLAQLRKTSKSNGETKFTNMYDQWISDRDIDPQVGRLPKRSDFRITDSLGRRLN